MSWKYTPDGGGGFSVDVILIVILCAIACAGFAMILGAGKPLGF